MELQIPRARLLHLDQMCLNSKHKLINMKHLSKGYIFNGKPIKNTKIEVGGINQRMTDAADGNTTRPRMLKKNQEDQEESEY